MTENYSLDQIQRKVDTWIAEHGGYWPPLSMLCAIMEELGEIAREINHLEGIKPKKYQNDSDLGEELADLLFSVICLSNHYEIDLAQNFEKILLKYSKRDAKRFT